MIEAIPVLVRQIENPYTKDTVFSFGMASRLSDDPVGRALVDIGESAVDAVGQLFRDSERSTRWRAALVLANMNSLNGDGVLESRLTDEKDRAVKRYIQSRLEEHKKAKID
jgi:hypothetical protein